MVLDMGIKRQSRRVRMRDSEGAPDEPIIALAKRCHDNLRSTRGVVMSLAAFDVADNLMAWLGIGNVQGVLQRADATLRVEEPLLMRAGVVGDQLPPCEPQSFQSILGIS